MVKAKMGRLGRQLALATAVCSLGALPASCASQSSQSASSPYYGQQSQPTTELYIPFAPMRQLASTLLRLPGFTNYQLVNYQVADNQAIMDGDIMLGPASTLPMRYGILSGGGGDPNVKSAVAINDKSHLWPNGEIPYEIDSSVSAQTIDSIHWAIGELNQTQLKVRPRQANEGNYVVFRDTGNGCTSYLGRIGGAQTVSTTGCSRGSLAHELLHAAGLYHEQSRSDRDNFVTIVWSEIQDGYQSNFETHPSTSVDIGSYDYGSIMHYCATAFSKSGQPTIVTKMPNAVIGQRNGLSQGDKAAIAQLYGSGGGTPLPTLPGPSTPTTPAPTSTYFPVPVAGSSFPLPWPSAAPAMPSSLPFPMPAPSQLPWPQQK
jgi:hypothetical protein